VKRLGLGVLVLLALLAGGALWLEQQVNARHEVAEQNIIVPHGASVHRIARLLEHHGVVSSARWFRWYVRWQGDAGAIKQGEYRFSGKLNMPDVLHILVDGAVLQHRLTVPEGLRTEDILSLLAQKTHTPIQVWQKSLHGLLADGDWEGSLLPETYAYTLPLQPQKILKQMRVAQTHLLEGLTPQQAKKIRIMASILEKETALARERPLVAAVIRNRLRLGMPLQMDPTVIYGIWKRDGVFSGNIHRKDLHTDTPWNSYTRKGLPPTPICNPGAASLRAAMQPANVDYLYFVADGTGGHAFAATLAQHQANVRAWVAMERKHHAR